MLEKDGSSFDNIKFDDSAEDDGKQVVMSTYSVF